MIIDNVMKACYGGNPGDYQSQKEKCEILSRDLQKEIEKLNKIIRWLDAKKAMAYYANAQKQEKKKDRLQ